MKRIMGAMIFLMGVGLIAWVGYNLFVEQLPETEGRRPFGPIAMSFAFLYVGFKWMRGESAD